MRFALVGDHPDGLGAIEAFLAADQRARADDLLWLGGRRRACPPARAESANHARSGRASCRPANRRRGGCQLNRATPCSPASSPAIRAACPLRPPGRHDPGHGLRGGHDPGRHGPHSPCRCFRLRHPAVVRLADWMRDPLSFLGRLRFLDMDWRSTALVPVAEGGKGPEAALPGWDFVRAHGEKLPRCPALHWEGDRGRAAADGVRALRSRLVVPASVSAARCRDENSRRVPGRARPSGTALSIGLAGSSHLALA